MDTLLFILGLMNLFFFIINMIDYVLKFNDEHRFYTNWWTVSSMMLSFTTGMYYVINYILCQTQH